ncbi:hypothetical protein LNP25_01180 [Klebsiella variicola subsp. variicola]|nr:hypothetical protein [Klebsiella variicola subsp. variicola]
MAELATRFPEDMKWAAPYDPSGFRARLHPRGGADCCWKQWCWWCWW